MLANFSVTVSAKVLRMPPLTMHTLLLPLPVVVVVAVTVAATTVIAVLTMFFATQFGV